MTKNINFVKTGLITGAIIVMSVPFLAGAAVLERQLEVGMSGSDVSALQAFLAQDNTIYPQGLVTGYFGPLTFAAVSNYQARNGIATVGRVGPITLASINAQMPGGIGGSNDVDSAVLSNVNINRNNNSATVSWNTSELAQGRVHYSSGPLSIYENLHSANVSGSVASTDNNVRTAHSVTLSGLQANTTYYYLIYATDVAGNVSVTWNTFQTTN